MMATPEKIKDEDLPVGAALVNSGMIIVSSNKLMCEYFSCNEAGINGLSICEALNCGSSTHECENCQIKSAVKRILAQNIFSDNFTVKQSPEKWFKVSGIPVNYFDKNYAALFFNGITERRRKEKSMRKKLMLDLHATLRSILI